MTVDQLAMAEAAGRAAAKDAPPLTEQQSQRLRALLRSALRETA